MALDPESQRLLDLAAAANRPAWNRLSPEAARAQYLALRPPSQGPRPGGVTVTDRTIPGQGGAIPIRHYRPTAAAADAALPALVFAHGGGWVFGNLDSHDVLCAQLALDAGIAVCAIDYRLAPEARFPGAFDDVVAGLQWVVANGASIGIDTSRLAIGGDSAGGNLAAAAAIWARDNGGPRLRSPILSPMPWHGPSPTAASTTATDSMPRPWNGSSIIMRPTRRAAATGACHRCVPRRWRACRRPW